MSSVLMSLPSFRTTVPMSASSRARIGDHAGDGAGRRDGRAAQVDLGPRVAHAALEVAVGGSKRHLLIPESPLVDAQTGTTARIHHHGTGFHEFLQVPGLKRLGVDPGTCRNS